MRSFSSASTAAGKLLNEKKSPGDMYPVHVQRMSILYPSERRELRCRESRGAFSVPHALWELMAFKNDYEGPSFSSIASWLPCLNGESLKGLFTFQDSRFCPHRSPWMPWYLSLSTGTFSAFVASTGMGRCWSAYSFSRCMKCLSVWVCTWQVTHRDVGGQLKGVCSLLPMLIQGSNSSHVGFGGKLLSSLSSLSSPGLCFVRTPIGCGVVWPDVVRFDGHSGNSRDP